MSTDALGGQRSEEEIYALLRVEMVELADLIRARLRTGTPASMLAAVVAVMMRDKYTSEMGRPAESGFAAAGTLVVMLAQEDCVCHNP